MSSCLFAYPGGPDCYVLYSRELSHPLVAHGAIALLVLARTTHIKEGVFAVEEGVNNDTVAAGVSSHHSRLHPPPQSDTSPGGPGVLNAVCSFGLPP